MLLMWIQSALLLVHLHFQHSAFVLLTQNEFNRNLQKKEHWCSLQIKTVFQVSEGEMCVNHTYTTYLYFILMSTMACLSETLFVKKKKKRLRVKYSEE